VSGLINCLASGLAVDPKSEFELRDGKERLVLSCFRTRVGIGKRTRWSLFSRISVSDLSFGKRRSSCLLPSSGYRVYAVRSIVALQKDKEPFVAFWHG
jgi:hypothetical protein